MLPLAGLCASALDAPMLTFYSFWSSCSGSDSQLSDIGTGVGTSVENSILSSDFSLAYLQHVLTWHDPLISSGFTSLL
jgi:hypothetical protein